MAEDENQEVQGVTPPGMASWVWAIVQVHKNVFH